jgi:ABC-type amino acid transport substrate-binding protein
MRKKIIITVVTAAFVLSSVLLGGAAQAAPDPKVAEFNLVSPGKLTVGMTLQFKPQMYLNDSGRPAGYDVELVKKLARTLGLKLVIVNMDFGGLIPGLMAKKFDMLSVGLTNRPPRELSMTFTREYMPYTTILSAQIGQKIGSTIADWNKPGIKITALQGSTAATLVTSTFPNATLVAFPDQSAAFLEVASGRANGSVVEANLSGQYMKSNPRQLANVKLPTPIQVGYGSWAVQLGNLALRDNLTSFICANMASGDLATIFKRQMGYSLPALPPCAK